MIPKFRAYIKEEKCFADYIETIRYYSKEVDLCWGGICESDCFSFEDVIFTQSTGRKDKDDNEIFEGDILGVETATSIIYVIVVWDSAYAMFMVKSEEYNEILTYGDLKPMYEKKDHIFSYSRSYKEQKLVLICNFSSEEKDIELLEDYENVVFVNYEQTTVIGNTLKMKPYECVVYSK